MKKILEVFNDNADCQVIFPSKQGILVTDFAIQREFNIVLIRPILWQPKKENEEYEPKSKYKVGESVE